MLANSFCAFLSFRALVLVGVFLLHLEAVFTSARVSLTANVSHDLALCLVGMHSVAASKWALTKFSYSSFGVCVSVSSCYASCLFLNVNALSNMPVIKQGPVIVYSGCCLGCILSWAQSYFCRDNSVIGGHNLAIQYAIIPFLIYKNVVYLCFIIICICVSS